MVEDEVQDQQAKVRLKTRYLNGREYLERLEQVRWSLMHHYVM